MPFGVGSSWDDSMLVGKGSRYRLIVVEGVVGEVGRGRPGLDLADSKSWMVSPCVGLMFNQLDPYLL